MNRYAPHPYRPNEMVTHGAGEFVRYDDVATLELRFASLLAATEEKLTLALQDRERLRAALREAAHYADMSDSPALASFCTGTLAPEPQPEEP